MMEIEKTILIVRHGTTANNAKGIWQGSGDHPLSPMGLEEAKALAAVLENEPIDAVYHSPMKRALQTAEIIGAGHNAAYIPVKDFVEINLGDFDGKTNTEIMADFSEAYQNWVWETEIPVPGGESFSGVCRRIAPAVDVILKSDHKHILIVAHAMVNRAILGKLMNIEDFAARRFRMDNCAYGKFRIYHTQRGPNIVLDYWNVKAT